jgi:hypothetical protein
VVELEFKDFIWNNGSMSIKYQVRINPKIVIKNGDILDDIGIIGSREGVIKNQFSVAPPIIAPIERNIVGEVKSLFVFDKL